MFMFINANKKYKNLNFIILKFDKKVYNRN